MKALNSSVNKQLTPAGQAETSLRLWELRANESTPGLYVLGGKLLTTVN